MKIPNISTRTVESKHDQGRIKLVAGPVRTAGGRPPFIFIFDKENQFVLQFLYFYKRKKPKHL